MVLASSPKITMPNHLILDVPLGTGKTEFALPAQKNISETQKVSVFLFLINALKVLKMEIALFASVDMTLLMVNVFSQKLTMLNLLTLDVEPGTGPTKFV